MNKIKVNMVPNPFDIQTLYCSQGDTEARKFYITLTQNNTLVDVSTGDYSLVGEQTEIPLVLSNGELVGECVTGLSSEPGYRTMKIRMNDNDGVCYSNKIKLFVERSPQ